MGRSAQNSNLAGKTFVRVVAISQAISALELRQCHPADTPSAAFQPLPCLNQPRELLEPLNPRNREGDFICLRHGSIQCIIRYDSTSISRFDKHQTQGERILEISGSVLAQSWCWSQKIFQSMFIKKS